MALNADIGMHRIKNDSIACHILHAFNASLISKQKIDFQSSTDKNTELNIHPTYLSNYEKSRKITDHCSPINTDSAESTESNSQSEHDQYLLKGLEECTKLFQKLRAHPSSDIISGVRLLRDFYHRPGFNKAAWEVHIYNQVIGNEVKNRMEKKGYNTRDIEDWLKVINQYI